jgi:hypothetical protein
MNKQLKGTRSLCQIIDSRVFGPALLGIGGLGKVLDEGCAVTVGVFL